MKYRIRISQNRTTELEVDAPHYDNAVLRAIEALQTAEWRVSNMQVQKIEAEPFEEERLRQRLKELEEIRDRKFGLPTDGTLFEEER